MARRSASAILATPHMQARRSGMPGAGAIGSFGPASRGGMTPPTGYPGSGGGSMSPWQPPAGGGGGAYKPGGGGMSPMGGGMPQMMGGKPMASAPSPFMRPGAGAGMGAGGGMTLAGGLQTSPMTMASPLTTSPASFAAPAAGGTTTAASTSTPGSFGPPSDQGAPGTGAPATDPWGYNTAPPLGPKIGRKGKKKFGGHGYAQRAYRKLPPWLQDPSMFESSIGNINDILARKGHISPEELIKNQADIEAGRGQSQQALNARLGAAGVDPGSMEALSMAGTVDQAGNRLQADARRQEEQDAFQRLSQALNMPIPYLQAILGMTTKHGGGGVQANAAGGGGGGSPDYLGAASNIASSVLGGWASSGFKT